MQSSAINIGGADATDDLIDDSGDDSVDSGGDASAPQRAIRRMLTPAPAHTRQQLDNKPDDAYKYIETKIMPADSSLKHGIPSDTKLHWSKSEHFNDSRIHKKSSFACWSYLCPGVCVLVLPFQQNMR